MSLRGATDYVQGINRITRCRATNYKTPMTLGAKATITHPHQPNELSLASMSEPIILTLTSWTQTRIQNLFAATTQAQFQEAYDAFFAQDVQLTVNNRSISRSDFENELWQTASTKTSASVQFLGTVEIPTDSSNPLEGGQVGTFHKDILELNETDIKKTSQLVITASENFVITPDPSLGPVFDARRAFVMNSIILLPGGSV
ncbi:hypothetical protein BDW22DRAFT_1432388 [Trametopsis cervina]|nr:hypothetical protein BDW22DRAFT_1432388 [Trametopsis cervina]